MNSHRFPIVIGVLLLVFQGEIWGGCGSVFPSGLQNFTNSGSIEFEKNSQLWGNPTISLPTFNLKTGGGAPTCGNQWCNQGNSVSQAITLPIFKTTNSNIKIQLNKNENYTLGSDGDTYQEIISAKGNATITDGGVYTEYRITRLDLQKNDRLILRGGTNYWIETLNFNGDNVQIIVTGTGTARLFVKNTLKTSKNSQINSGGSANQLMIIAYNDIKFDGDNQQVKGLLYAAQDVEIDKSSTITGAIAAGQEIKLNKNSTVTYSSSAVNSVQDNGLCPSSSADLKLTKTVSNNAPDIGHTIAFTLTLENLGPGDATQVSVQDGLPTGLSLVANSATSTLGSFDEATLTWTLPSLVNGATATATFMTIVDQGGVLINQASVSGMDQQDPDTTNNSDQVTVVAGAAFAMEVGEVTIVNTYQKVEFTNVTFTQKFTSPPLVFTLPTTDGANTAAHRIRNVTKTGFQVMTVEPDGEDGPHISMRLNFLAIASGIHKLSDGNLLEAGEISTDRYQQYGTGDTGWSHINFQIPYASTPAVLLQVQTMNNEVGNIPSSPSKPWLTSAVQNITTAGMDVALERSESISGSVTQPETIGYLVSVPIPRSTIDIYGGSVTYEILRSDAVIDGWANYGEFITFSSAWPAAPLVVASMNSRNNPEDDGGWLRREYTNTTGVLLRVDEVRRGVNNFDGNRSRGKVERAGIFAFSGNFITEPAFTLDHYRIEHDATGLTCESAPITLKACADAGCTAYYIGSATVNLQPSNNATKWWGTGIASNQVEFSNGSVDLQLSYDTPGIITLSANGNPVPTNGYQCYLRGTQTQTNCQMSFKDTGLVFAADGVINNIQTQIAGKSSVILDLGIGYTPQALVLKAVRKDTNSGACVARLTGQQTVRMGFQCVDPSSCMGGQLVVNGTSVDANGFGSFANLSNVTLSFDAAGEAPFSLSYTDAGQVRLYAEKTFTDVAAGPNITLSGESNVFTVKPAGFCVQSPDLGDCLTANENCPAVKKAGEVFNESVTAVDWDAVGDTDLCIGNSKTPNFEQLGITLSHTLVAPAGGLLGNLGNTSLDISSGGTATAFQNIDEVGIFTLTAATNNYFGETVTGTSLPIGRFFPARLQVTDNVPSFTPSCSGSFSYFGQEFGYGLDPEVAVTGLNNAGGVTSNYDSAFWRLNTTLANRQYVKDIALTSTTIMAPPTTVGTVTVSDSNNLDGDRLYTISGERLTASREANPENPILATTPLVDLTLPAADLTDADGVCFDNNLDSICDDYQIADISGTELRYGTGFSQDVHGTQGLAGDSLVMPIGVNYWDSSLGGWTLNASDNCTSYSYTDSGTATVSIAPGSPVVISNGLGNLTLTLGANSLDQTRNVSVDWPAWLEPDTQATAHFGIFRGDDRFIYWREVK